MSKVLKDAIGYKLKIPFDVIKHSEAMARFGSDKPDRRYGMELVELSDSLKDCNFNVFKQAISSEGIVKAINLKKPKEMPRSRIDSLTDFIKQQGLGGLAYFKVEGDSLTGPISKFFSDEETSIIKKKMCAETGDYLLIGAGGASIVNEALSKLRSKLAQEEDLIDEKVFDFLWVTEFPLLKYNEDEKRWESEHHPFTAFYDEDVSYFDGDKAKIRARSYDLVVNGVELGSGSIRIHRKDLQEKLFKAIGIDKKEAEDRFGFLTQALSFGAPPHGGVAVGLDRLTAMLCGCDSIREVIAFPKTQKAICPLTKAPSYASEEQLNELGLELKENK